MKKCSVCQRVLADEEFSKTNNGAISSTCKACKAKAQREWYEANKPEVQINRNAKNISTSLNKLQANAKAQGYNVIVRDTDGKFIVALEKL